MLTGHVGMNYDKNATTSNLNFSFPCTDGVPVQPVGPVQGLVGAVGASTGPSGPTARPSVHHRGPVSVSVQGQCRDGKISCVSVAL